MFEKLVIPKITRKKTQKGKEKNTKIKPSVLHPDWYKLYSLQMDIFLFFSQSVLQGKQ